MWVGSLLAKTLPIRSQYMLYAGDDEVLGKPSNFNTQHVERARGKMTSIFAREAPQFASSFF
jgi:hypothetical protein